MTEKLLDIYNRLLSTFGEQHWWPADTVFEVIIGTILTQNTNWKNVEKAIANLRSAAALNIRAIDRMSPEKLEQLIRPSGYFRQKTVRLQSFTGWILETWGGLDQLLTAPADELRQKLLQQPGIGPETADSIILYAAGQPTFVVDAYTHRILVRLGLEQPGTAYEETRRMFMDNLPPTPSLFNQYHALLVRLAKEHCRKREPLCTDCPLLVLCPTGELNVGH
ncbi:MAG: endonuclease [Desulfuromonas sp.]|nr:MAG: endonuclease [Desulfuromonas sp.]